VESQCHFDLHFLFGQRCWGSLHMVITYLYLFFWKLSVQFICPFIQWVIDLLRG
jgi:hypothetical protein